MALSASALSATVTAENTAFAARNAGENKPTAAGSVVKDLSAKVSGDNFIVSWKLLLDQVSPRSNSMMVFIPVVEDNDGHTALLRPVAVCGRNAHYDYLRNGLPAYPDAIALRKDKAGTEAYDYRQAVPLDDWMRRAHVTVRLDTCGCGDLVASRPVGGPFEVDPRYPERIALAYRVPVVGDDPVLSLHGRAYLDFRVNRTELDPNYHNNPDELHKIRHTIDTVKNNKRVEITHIGIHGYASPEGSYSNNIRLASGRAATLKDYVREQCDLPEKLFTVKSTPEDWAGLDSFLVASPTLSNRDAILKIARSNEEPDARNTRIQREYPKEYAYILASCYPYLRHSDYEIAYKVRPMSDEEAAELIDVEPRLLSLYKMYRVANLYAPGSKEYNHVIDVALTVYPQAEEARICAANVALRAGDVATARMHLAQAGQSPEADNARGCLELLSDNMAAARKYFDRAAKAGNAEARKNLELIP